jgi:hypothetical protein
MNTLLRRSIYVLAVAFALLAVAARLQAQCLPKEFRLLLFELAHGLCSSMWSLPTSRGSLSVV